MKLLPAAIGAPFPAKSRPFWQLLLVGFLFLQSGRGRAQEFTVLHDFFGPEGAYPSGGLTADGSTVYGTTTSEGGEAGTLFRINADGGNFTVLHRFTYNEGLNPNGSMVLADNTLYGTTAGQNSSWYGSVFRVKTDGSDFQVLKTFTGGADGDQPSPPVRSGSFLFGTTVSGGLSNRGTIFRIGLDGSDFVVLKHLGSGTGMNPNGGLVLVNSLLYGTTMNGGTYGAGTLFRIRTDGTGFEPIKSYGAPGTADHGTNPIGELTQAGETLYGCTVIGGQDPGGTVFKVRTDGTGYQVLHYFTGAEGGAAPSTSLILDHDTLYGTTFLGGAADSVCPQGCGTVFKVRTDGTGFATLRKFTGQLDGSQLVGSRLIRSANGLIGAARLGGAASKGVLFSITLPLYPRTVAVTARPAGGVLAVWNGSPGTKYEVLASTQLTTWSPFAQVLSDANGVFSITDPVGDGPTRFYRATIP